ncbi:MAG: hypothetical protein H7144_10050 [Burkholderiales bacterium]|nr:hypothetical protein [Phycisphaerae bacterium]
MNRSSDTQSHRAVRADALPPNTPAWITAALVLNTIRVWQPRYKNTISVSEAITMLTRVGQLMDVLFGERRHAKEICRVGEGVIGQTEE